MSWYQFVLFLHILVAIIGFGPAFSYAIIASLGQKEFAHNNFALRVITEIEKRIGTPLSIVMPGLGALLIYLGKWDLWKSEWLIIAIVIYTVLFFVAVFVVDRAGHRLVELTREGTGPPGGGGPAAVSGGEGPPPEVARLLKVVQIGGAFLGLAVVAILLLMVWKPGGEFVTR